MVSKNVIIKEGAQIPEGAICSLLTFDTDEKEFTMIDTDAPDQINLEYFEKGVIPCVPRDLQLKANELMGSVSAYEKEIESELDSSMSESDADPVEDFTKDAEELFMDSLKNYENKTISQNDFVKNLVTEIRSCKLTYNVNNQICSSVLCKLALGTMTAKALKTNQQIAATAQKTIKLYQPLISNFCVGDVDE